MADFTPVPVKPTVGIAALEALEIGKHPTQKPVALLERILLASSHEGDLVRSPAAETKRVDASDSHFFRCDTKKQIGPSRPVPNWELFGYTPAVFGRV